MIKNVILLKQSDIEGKIFSHLIFNKTTDNKEKNTIAPKPQIRLSLPKKPSFLSIIIT